MSFSIRSPETQHAFLVKSGIEVYFQHLTILVLLSQFFVLWHWCSEVSVWNIWEFFCEKLAVVVIFIHPWHLCSLFRLIGVLWSNKVGLFRLQLKFLDLGIKLGITNRLVLRLYGSYNFLFPFLIWKMVFNIEKVYIIPGKLLSLRAR